MLTLSYLARSQQIAAAARLLTASWLYSVVIWRLLDPPATYAALMLADAILAMIFYRMSERRVFPAPLFVLEIIMVLHSVAIAILQTPLPYIGIILNRIFELAVLYVSGCALYRIRVRREELETEARRGADPRRAKARRFGGLSGPP